MFNLCFISGRCDLIDGVGQIRPARQGLVRGQLIRIAVPAGVIASRDDAMRALQRVCEWIELNEPSNPAPLLRAASM